MTPRGDHRTGAHRTGHLNVPLSILDSSPIDPGTTAADALRETTTLARRAEDWGYHRMWVTEHHANRAVAGSCPPVLIAHLAAMTSTLRIGSGATLLPNHAPLAVAEQYATLHALHGHRIDLGIGRDPGTDPTLDAALRRQSGDYEEQIRELTGFLTGTFPPGHRYHGMSVAGAADADENAGLPLWILGATRTSAGIAARFGRPFTFAHHLNPDDAVAAIAHYRDHFRPSCALREPYAMVCVRAFASTSHREATRVIRSVLRSDITAGSPASRATAAITANLAWGSAEHVVERLEHTRARTSADEIMVTGNFLPDAGLRQESLRLIARAAGTGA
ncbi:MsnO8 family LLM class oxidoreductase [Streptomyces sp. NPDC048514]|uniref:MsnO8 family LLM class oxidoreductase n=1 Tax=Streptomyces sp. NPDC048514 TaxID=3365564 RepID=UPI00371A7F8B